MLLQLKKDDADEMVEIFIKLRDTQRTTIQELFKQVNSYSCDANERKKIKSALEKSHKSIMEKYSRFIKLFSDSCGDEFTEKCISRGGYIHDSNGVPCREGDRVEIFCFGKKPEPVTLGWNPNYKAFDIIHADGTSELLAAYQFKKMEE